MELLPAQDQASLNSVVWWICVLRTGSQQATVSTDAGRGRAWVTRH